MSSDVLTKRDWYRFVGCRASAGSPGAGFNRGRCGPLTVTDGNGGDTMLDIDFLASDSHSVNIPDDGIRFASDVYVSAATNITAITFFYS